MSAIRKGSQVRWKWGSSTATGKVVERFGRTVTRTLKGSKVTKRGSEETPAFLIEQDDGDRVLKLSTELDSA